METTTETTDRNPVAAAIERGYERADARVKELAADSGLSPLARRDILLAEAAEALDPIGEKVGHLGERLSLDDSPGWESEMAGDLQADVTIDLEEQSRLVGLASVDFEAKERSINAEKMALQADLLKDVETLAAHPWKGIDLTSAPEHHDFYGAADRDQLVSRLDGVLEQCGLDATENQVHDITPPKSVEIVDDWGKQREERSVHQLSFPKAPTLTPNTTMGMVAGQKATNSIASNIRPGGNDLGR